MFRHQAIPFKIDSTDFYKTTAVLTEPTSVIGLFGCNAWLVKRIEPKNHFKFFTVIAAVIWVI